MSSVHSLLKLFDSNFTEIKSRVLRFQEYHSTFLPLVFQILSFFGGR